MFNSPLCLPLFTIHHPVSCIVFHINHTTHAHILNYILSSHASLNDAHLQREEYTTLQSFPPQKSKTGVRYTNTMSPEVVNCLRMFRMSRFVTSFIFPLVICTARSWSPPTLSLLCDCLCLPLKLFNNQIGAQLLRRFNVNLLPTKL